MPENMILGYFLVARQILGFVIHSQGQPPRQNGGGRGIQPRKPHGDRLQGGESVDTRFRAESCSSRTHSAFQRLDSGRIPSSQPSSILEHPNDVLAAT